jgi:nucleoside-diphosphate-sugar epimerase
MGEAPHERCSAVFHAATLHKPHVATRSRQEFVDFNIGGTLNLLEEAVTACFESFVYTSTTSVLVTRLCRRSELQQHGSRKRFRFNAGDGSINS